MKNYEKMKETYDRNYKRNEAMYYKGYTINQIVDSMPSMDKIEVISIIQTIEGLKHRKFNTTRA